MSRQGTKISEGQWNEYLVRELPQIADLLKPYHITLSPDQPHIKGERFLMQALTTIGGKKLILLGIDLKTNERVVIKVANDTEGKHELCHERLCRKMLNAMKFSYETFHSPQELIFIEKNNYVIYVSAYIPQSCSYLERPLEEQFTFALRAFKSQERTRATTAKHFSQIKRVYGSRNSSNYLAMAKAFLSTNVQKDAPETSIATLSRAAQHLEQHLPHIEQYCGFLTHTDFVPHNIRIADDTLYLLDFSSLRFGNKHESWARFLNFMTLYNPDLEQLLITYVEQNRSYEERESLQLMRMFRLMEIITYYVTTCEKSAGDLLQLNKARIDFWRQVLEAELSNNRVDRSIVSTYTNTRDALRSGAEKERQMGLH